jgi:hypothetical protein
MPLVVVLLVYNNNNNNNNGKVVPVHGVKAYREEAWL